jgi:pyrophosphatase PpaX
MKKLALLFDLDGTLIDSIGLLLESMEHAFANRTHRPTTATWTAGIGKPLRVQMTEWAANGDDVEILVGLYREYQHHNLERLTIIYPEVLETLPVGQSTWPRTRPRDQQRVGNDRTVAHAHSPRRPV